MKIYFGYVSEETEIDIYNNYLSISHNLEQIQQVLSQQDILNLQQEAENVFVHAEIVKAVSNIVRATRVHEGISLGASTRSGITFLKCLKANALVNGRTFVIEDDVNEIAIAVLDHRLIYKNKEAKQNSLGQILTKEMDRLSKLKLY
jgi:MoxR-like ATPase